MKRIVFIALISLCSTLGFSQTDETGKVLGVERVTAEAFTKHALPQLNTIFADDASIITQKAELITKQQLLQYVPNINSLVVSDMKVKLKGNIAIVTGIQLETGKNESGVYTSRSRFTDVLEKRSGNWVIIASHLTSMDQEQ